MFSCDACSGCSDLKRRKPDSVVYQSFSPMTLHHVDMSSDAVWSGNNHTNTNSK